MIKFPSQVSLLDQLKKLVELANKNGLYDAADYVKEVVAKQERKNEVCTKA